VTKGVGFIVDSEIDRVDWAEAKAKLGRDTGITDGPPIRYVLPGKHGWNTSGTWPPSGFEHRALWLRADGGLADEEGEPGERSYVTLGSGLKRRAPKPTDPPAMLRWTGPPLEAPLDLVGNAEVICASIVHRHRHRLDPHAPGHPRGRNRGRHHRRVAARRSAHGRRRCDSRSSGVRSVPQTCHIRLVDHQTIFDQMEML